MVEGNYLLVGYVHAGTFRARRKYSHARSAYANKRDVIFSGLITQLTFICSKATIETLQKDVKYVQS